MGLNAFDFGSRIKHGVGQISLISNQHELQPFSYNIFLHMC